MLNKLIGICLIGALCTNCLKDKYLANHSEWVGSYDWVYSTDDNNSVIDLNQSGDRYGFKIKRSGKVLFFKNGKYIHSGKFDSESASYDGLKIVAAKSGTHKLTNEFGEIRLRDFPMKDFTNVFKKLDK
ncbi:MAG: hypothetical protein V4604_17180 [Bacteroidota bacterium]